MADTLTTFDAAGFLAGLTEAPKPVTIALVGQRAAACETCLCAIAWATADGPVCAACHPRPQGVAKLVVVDELGGAIWRDYQTELAGQRSLSAIESIAPVDADAVCWASAVEWTDATPTCAKCGTAATWGDARDCVRCLKCDPPRLAERTLATARGIRRRLRFDRPAELDRRQMALDGNADVV